MHVPSDRPESRTFLFVVILLNKAHCNLLTKWILRSTCINQGLSRKVEHVAGNPIQEIYYGPERCWKCWPPTKVRHRQLERCVSCMPVFSFLLGRMLSKWVSKFFIILFFFFHFISEGQWDDKTCPRHKQKICNMCSLDSAYSNCLHNLSHESRIPVNLKIESLACCSINLRNTEIPHGTTSSILIRNCDEPQKEASLEEHK